MDSGSKVESPGKREGIEGMRDRGRVQLPGRQLSPETEEFFLPRCEGEVSLQVGQGRTGMLFMRALSWALFLFPFLLRVASV